MGIDKTNLTTQINNRIANANSSCSIEDMVALAASTDITTDRKSIVSLGCDLPDLASVNIPEGTVYYVQELGVPVVASNTSWLGLDGRTYRQDLFLRQLYSWGSNNNGQIGDETTINRSSPVQEISSSTSWNKIGLGEFHTSSIKTDGTLWAWGGNGYGPIGDGTTISRSSPVQEITSSTNWSSVSSGGYSTAAINTSGEIYSWGYNFRGILGDGTDDHRSSPVQEISSSVDWCQVSISRTTNAIKTNGTMWVWGFNNWGQLGIGSTACRCSPVQEITSSTNWCLAATGIAHSLTLKTDGTLWAVGYRGFGRLGDGADISRSSPVQEITSSTNWCTTDAGWNHSIGINTSGELYSWGYAAGGRLGDGQTGNSRSSPVQEISSSTNWCLASGGNSHTAALKTTGSAWLWGWNFCGALGDNTSTCRLSPVQEISSSTNWCTVNTDNFTNAAIKLV